MQNIDEMIQFVKHDEGANMKELIFRLLPKWYWFALFGFLGVAGGYLVTRYSQPVYRIESTVLLNDETQGMGLDNLFEGFDLGSKTNIENHLLMLKSHSLNRQTLENLGRKVSWFRKGIFTDASLYGNYPYTVEVHEGEYNLVDMPILITPLPDETYKVKVDGIVHWNDDSETKVAFEKNGKYGVPFENSYFNFTLTKNDGFSSNEDADYYFIFNDQNNLTRSYLERLDVSLATKKANAIRLTLKGSNPMREVEYLNELVRVYMEYGLNEKNRTSENTVFFIDGQLKGILDSLNIASQHFTDFRSKNGVVDLGQEAGLVMEKMEELETEQSVAVMRFEYYKRLRKYLSEGNRMKEVVSPSVVGITDPALNAQVLKLGELYSKRDVLSYSVHNDNPSLLIVDKEINNTRQRLSENIDNLLSNAEIEVNSLEKRKKRINAQLTSLPKTEQELIEIKRRFDLNNELYTFLLQKRAEAAITKASNVSDAQVLDVALIENAEQVGPKELLNLVVGLILGLAIPFLFIGISDYFNDTIRSREEVEKETKLPVLGSVVHRPYAKELVVAEYPRSGISESYRGLRTNLRFMLPDNEKRVISVQSTIPGEGKTVTSTNLAAIMAMNNKKVLLVGCDLRKPRLHKIFEVDNKTGLSSYLSGAHNFDEVVKQTSIKNLSLVVGGIMPPNPAELLENGEFERFISEAKSRFDYLILDNAPVSVVSDGILSGTHADINLFLIRENYSHKEQIKYINQFSESKTIENIVLVYNDVKKTGYGYGNKYRGYNYRYNHGYYDDKYRFKMKMFSKK